MVESLGIWGGAGWRERRRLRVARWASWSSAAPGEAA